MDERIGHAELEKCSKIINSQAIVYIISLLISISLDEIRYRIYHKIYVTL